MDLAQFDEAASVVPAAAPAIVKTSRIFNGYYTLTCPDGSRKTFRISTKPLNSKFAPGRRIISLLIGPQNTSDYEGFGFVDEAGIHVWKSKRGAKLERYASVIWSLAIGEAIEDYQLVVSRRCLRCNRLLTTPESIARGIGPMCNEMGG